VWGKNRGFEGWQLEIKIGMLDIGETRELGLWSPWTEHDYAPPPHLDFWIDGDKPELLKLLKVINAIENKIEFTQWVIYNCKEWDKWEEKMRDCRRIFRFDLERNIDW